MSRAESGLDGYVDVSVANLIIQLGYYVGMPPRNRSEFFFAVENPKDPSKPLQHLSAGPKFTYAAKAFILREFNADPTGFVGNDARCRIPAEVVDDFESWLYHEVCKDASIVTFDPALELYDRLTKPYWKDLQPPWTEAEAASCSISRIGHKPLMQPQPEGGEDRGGRGAKVRFFWHWGLFYRQEVIQKLIKHPAFVLLSEDAMKTTHGGRRVGRAFGDRYQLANNIGVRDDRPFPIA